MQDTAAQGNGSIYRAHIRNRNWRHTVHLFEASLWIGVRLELLGNTILLGSILMALLSDSLNGAQLGMSIMYAIQVTSGLNIFVWAIAETEMNSVSVERVREYSTLPAEADWSEGNVDPPALWPFSGSIDLMDFSTKYRPELAPVLKGVTVSIKHGEKIGIVGRTGAGKSSLALSLFRIIEAAGGRIQIDGVNICDLGLHRLRSNISILPQDPVLFSGTLRMNVDPVSLFTDAQIWRAIEFAHLKKFAEGIADGLDYDCGDSGHNLSLGQRQLVCLARTLLNKSNILILDEATAAVDMATDDLIQQTIRTQFDDCTILTIAHRLNTIMDYDRVMVLDEGIAKQFASPKELLNDKNGLFFSMANDASLL